MTFRNRPMAKRTVLVAVATLAGAAVLALPSCTSILKTVDPCGTVLDCAPGTFDLLLADVPDWEVDPTCTIPGQCADANSGAITEDYISPFAALGPNAWNP
jgi:hypothetical protein